MNQKQIDTWWSATQEQLSLERLASGNRMMVDGATAKGKGADIEIRGGEIPITSEHVVQLISRDEEGRSMGLVFPEMPGRGTFSKKRRGA
jgi:hypothetical protein